MSLFDKSCPTCIFDDGYFSTNIVGKKDYFKDKDDFLNYCKRGYGEYYEALDNANIENIYINYVRWFPNGVEGMDMDERRGVYSFGRKSRGSIEVYVLDL